MARRAGGILGKMCVMMIVLGAPPVLRAQAVSEVSFDKVVVVLPDPETGEQLGAQLLRTRGSALMKRSTTFAELVTAIAGRSDLTLTVRPSSLPRWLGLGRYQVVNGHIYGAITMNPYPADRRLAERALAHELAHALEIACLLDSDLAGWREKLAERASRITSPGTFETPFADAIETAVARESRGSYRGSVPLLALVRRYGLGDCQLAAGVTQLVSERP